MPDLLLELRSEEVPADAQERARADLARLLAAGLAEAGIPAADVRGYATPRRLAAVAAGVPGERPGAREERRGPRADAPARAVEGFLRSTGLARGDLEVRETGKGAFLFAAVERPARPAAEILAEVVPEVIARVPWRKSMRWGGGTFRWARPLHGIVCLLGDRAVAFEAGGLRAGAATRGHRFLAPGPVELRSAAGYADALREARVLVDPEERRARILEAGRAAAEGEGLRFPDGDAALLDEVAGLVEWPVVLVGGFDESFLDLPPEVLRTAMRRHQRYFPLARPDGGPAPRFVVVADIEARDGGEAVRRGNERVLRARLDDARFFWNQDRRRPLADRLPELEGVAFHAKLGTMADKARRMADLAASLAPRIPGLDAARAGEAARLAKADLAAGLVGEFPELQGVVGGHLARAEGLGDDLAEAVARHHAPAGPDDACPAGPLAAAVALADKLDTLAGFFAAGERPTGSGDPFALRRAALGVVRIVLENGLRLPLREAFAAARRGYPGDADLLPAGEAVDALLAFVLERLRVHLRAEGARHDHVAAVFAAAGDDDLVRLVARAGALGAFLATPAGADLLAAHRRAAGIVAIEEKRDGAAVAGAPDPAAFAEDAERALGAALEAAGERARAALGAEDHAGAMGALAELRDPVDAFFEKVTVNAGDPALRANRLRLLCALRTVFDRVADLSLVEGGESGRDD